LLGPRPISSGRIEDPDADNLVKDAETCVDSATSALSARSLG
jgi:hypothetical protein